MEGIFSEAQLVQVKVGSRGCAQRNLQHQRLTRDHHAMSPNHTNRSKSKCATSFICMIFVSFGYSWRSVPCLLRRESETEWAKSKTSSWLYPRLIGTCATAQTKSEVERGQVESTVARGRFYRYSLYVVWKKGSCDEVNNRQQRLVNLWTTKYDCSII
jgi:hypothetical protein